MKKIFKLAILSACAIFSNLAFAENPTWCKPLKFPDTVTFSKIKDLPYYHYYIQPFTITMPTDLSQKEILLSLMTYSIWETAAPYASYDDVLQEKNILLSNSTSTINPTLKLRSRVNGIGKMLYILYVYVAKDQPYKNGICQFSTDTYVSVIE